MKKALVVGIDYYRKSIGELYGCVNDAHSVKGMLERHGDGSVNFDTLLLTGTGPKTKITKGALRDSVESLFVSDGEISFFYFSGHGYVDAAGGYILGSDAARGDDGVSLSEIVVFANRSRARNRIIVLDSCHSGCAGTSQSSGMAEIAEGVTVLTASTADQYASEENGSGIFTSLFVDALSGAAANLVGDISPGSVYAHVDQSLGSWDQRPVFKTNVKSFVSLRKVTPPISLDELRRIVEFFPAAGSQFALDPTFEPEEKGRDVGMPHPDPTNVQKFSVLQKFNRVNLVVPVDAPHMWHAAMGSKGCRLTVLGEHYRRLVAKDRI